MSKKLFSFKELIIFCFITALLFGFSCSFVVYRHYETKDVEYDFKSVTSDEYLSELLSKYEEIVNNYYEDVDKEKLVDAALSAMLNYLGDPYTTYLDEDQASNLLEQLEGKYTGIGIEVTTDDTSSVIISKVFDSSPAASAGLLPQDILISVNDKVINAGNMNQITDEIKKGSEATSKFTIVRNNVQHSYNITRSSLMIPSVETEVLDNNVGYMKISIFSGTTSDQVALGLKKLSASNISKLIIDLRNNTGGYLYSAEGIIEQFLEKGKLMYSISSKDSKVEYKDKTDTSTNYKIVLLVNGATASASEILTGALKESYGATIVGVKTYGKGKVQQTSTTDSGGLIKYTSAKWLTPSGVCIDGVGFTPDYVVELSSEYIANPIRINDNQLSKAIEVISNN